MAAVAARPRRWGVGEARVTRSKQTMMARSGEHLRQSLPQMVDEDATGAEVQEVALLLRTSTVCYGRHVRLYVTLLVAAAAVAVVLASAELQYRAQNRAARVCDPQPRRLYRAQRAFQLMRCLRVRLAAMSLRTQEVLRAREWGLA